MDWTQHPEIRLERNWPVLLRVAAVAGALLFMGWELISAFASTGLGSPGNGARLIVSIGFSITIILASVFAANIRWIIRPDEIRIERKGIVGAPRVEIIQRSDIRDVTIFRENTEDGWRTWLLLDRLSARSIESPAARFGTEPDQLRNAIATRLLITPIVKQI